MEIHANLDKFKDAEESETSYILIRFLTDVKNKVTPLLIPSIEFIKANYHNETNIRLFEVNYEGGFFITIEGEMLLNHLKETAGYNLNDLKVIL